ncbi:hypothetical protein KR093_007572, partial [Drosophila rubida]
MRVAQEKTKFFKESVEFLGFIVTRDGARTDPEKVRAIQEYVEPKSLFALRSFLGLASYYRAFSESHYATNERELLAIVWALGKLQHYLYGTREINIFTDHQPLTFAVSERNTNAKIKRWKAFIEEHNARIHYKPGKENFVADALSRQNVNALQNEPQSDAATIHSEVSLTYTVETTKKPLNCFRNQIVLEEARFPLKRTLIIFGRKTRHIIHFSNK